MKRIKPDDKGRPRNKKLTTPGTVNSDITYAIRFQIFLITLQAFDQPHRERDM